MKRLLLLCSLVLVGCSDQTGPSGWADLIRNGDFERGLESWSGAAALETGAFRLGASSLRASDDGGARSVQMVESNGSRVYIPTTPGDTLWLAFTIRAGANDVAPRVHVLQHDQQKGTLGSFSRGAFLTPDTWHEHYYRVILGPGVRYVSVVLDVVGAGTAPAWFDDIHLCQSPAPC